MPLAREKAVFKFLKLVALQVVAAVGANPGPAGNVVETFIGFVKRALSHRLDLAITKSQKSCSLPRCFAPPKIASHRHFCGLHSIPA